MPSRVKFKRNSAGIAALLRSTEAQEAVNRGARRIKDKTAGGYHVHAGSGGRARAYVSVDDTEEGYLASANRVLERVMGDYPMSSRGDWRNRGGSDA